MQIVLVHPEIPHNTGAIGRLCVGLGARLHLVRPLGFQLTDRLVKRAGLDYWPHLDVHVHEDWDVCRAATTPSRLWLATTKGSRSLYECTFTHGDTLVFGSESCGLPDEIHAQVPERRFAIPMPGAHARSLNLAQAVAVAAYELYRQTRAAVFETAAADDLADVAKLANRIWPSAYAGIIPDVQIRYMLDEYYSPQQLQADLREGVRFVYVVVDRRRVGFLAIGPSEREGEALLHKVYLLPECHGRGVGSAMLREALRQAREAGYRTVTLYVNRRNERAILAYQRNGFRTRREVVTEIGHGFMKDDYLMECELA